jgi:glutamyl-tRNA synthetase
VGNARTALVAWLSVRSRGGSFVWRLEDLDPPRAVPGVAEAALEDLRWLGLDWDEGPDVGGPYAPYEQSKRSEHYEDALRRLAEEGRLFPCHRSRKDLRELATAPHAGQGPPPYPKRLRPDEVAEGWFERFQAPGAGGPDAAIRFRVHEEPVGFHDLVLGEQVQWVDLEVGDFVLKRRDGLYAYQLAVVVDDLLMGIDEVVRGVDLLDSTGRQMQLIEALGGEPPAYAHVPLILTAEGEKISKRDGGLTLQSLRQEGVTPEALSGFLAHSAGLLDRPEPCRPEELLAEFRWDALGREDWVMRSGSWL